ncbi:MAG: hypothetical protein IPH46_07505 [Bacteroidetes bacterium]|nr:hypothetical protein [Bacteroidota bacterium]
MENKLTLHEAIVVVLSQKPNKTATTQEIADEINKRELYRKGQWNTCARISNSNED